MSDTMIVLHKEGGESPELPAHHFRGGSITGTNYFSFDRSRFDPEAGILTDEPLYPFPHAGKREWIRSNDA